MHPNVLPHWPCSPWQHRGPNFGELLPPAALPCLSGLLGSCGRWSGCPSPASTAAKLSRTLPIFPVGACPRLCTLFSAHPAQALAAG